MARKCVDPSSYALAGGGLADGLICMAPETSSSTLHVTLTHTFILTGNSFVYGDGTVRSFESSSGIFESLRVGVFQGTFDPPTRAHHELAATSLRFCDLLLLYPTNRNSRKTPIALEHRVQMLLLGLHRRSRPRTLIAFCQCQPPFPVFLAGCRERFLGDYLIVQGFDKLSDLPWYTQPDHPAQNLRYLPHLIYVPYAADPNVERRLTSQIKGQLNLLRGPQEQRSSFVRARLSAGQSTIAKKMLRPTVFEYIRRKGLYAASNESS